ncbi:nicotinate phosphoribosyltransferase [Thermodesulfobacteriota bacterium]
MARRNTSPLLTDLYQLTMIQGFFLEGMQEPATFEFFVRSLPDTRSFLMAAGLEQVLNYLETLAFSEKDIELLAQSKLFKKEFLEYLRTFRFTGEVHAMPEGTIFFQDEPVLQVTAPLPQAQFIETRLMNILQYQIMIASKAARIKLAAPNKFLVDFGLRRAHGAEAGLFASRASYIAGFSGTSNVMAGYQYGIPLNGTMSHSFIQAHDSETLAFKHFAEIQPENAVFLLDTYDTEAAAEKVVLMAEELAAQGILIKGVRLDSGNLSELSFRVRDILDRGGLNEVKIYTSGNLDEYRIKKMIDEDAPVDGFGVGTRLDTSSDVPYLDCGYKLQEYAGHARRKRSEGKATWPGRKQVYRFYEDDGSMMLDILTLEEDDIGDGEPLLKPFMIGGAREGEQTSLNEIQDYAHEQLIRLPKQFKRLVGEAIFPVQISSPLRSLALDVDERMIQINGYNEFALK